MKRNKLLTLFAAVLMLFSVQSANAFTLTCLSGSDFGGGEGCQKLFDGTQDTKWGTWDGWYGTNPWTVFKAALPIAPTTYELVIANDTNGSTGRNWKKWKIYGGNFASDDAATKDAEGWVVLDEKETELPTGQFEVVPLTLSAPDGVFYSYFKIVIEELRGGWGEYCQMDEFRFADFTVDTSAAQAYLDFDYETGTDADLVAAYSAKKDDLSAAIATNDPDQIVPAVEAIMPVYNEIVTIRNGGFFALDWTAAWGDGPGSNLVDKDDYSKWGGNFPEEGEHVQWVVFRAQSQHPYFYKLVTGGDTERWNTRNWKTWKVFGGNFASEEEATRSAEGWVVLDEREDISTDYLPNKNNYPATLQFTNGVKAAYSFYKVEVYASGGSQQQMSEIYLCTEEEFNEIRQGLVDGLAEFAATVESLVVTSDMEAGKTEFATKYEELKTLTNADELTIKYNELVALKEALEESAAFAAGGYRCLSGNTAWGDNENWTKLIDGNVSTKWGGGMPEDGSFVIFKAYQATKFNQYELVTGNDTKNSPGRNWKTWKIYGASGKVPGGTEEADYYTRDYSGWTLLDQKTDIGQDQLPAANYEPVFFNFSEEWPKSYKFFKIEVEAAYDGGSIQMSEFKMLSDEDYAAVRQEYVDSLTKVAMGLTALAEGLPASVAEALMAQVQPAVEAKIGAVATAEANNLYPLFTDALNFIKVEVPAMVAEAVPAQVEGVYQIANVKHFTTFAAIANGGENEAKAVLTADIDLAGTTWAPIGTPDVPFKGTFDGQGKAITNFAGETDAAVGKYGLFGNIEGATVGNFSIAGTLTVPDGAANGSGVVGWAVSSTISNIYSTLVIEAGDNGAKHVGGIVGSAQSGANTITNCTFAGSLTVGTGTHDCFGGIAGYISSDAVTNCINLGTIDYYTENCYAGGIVGYINNANPTVANCLGIGAVTYKGEGTASWGGAIIGRHRQDAAKVENNYWLTGSAKAASSDKVLTAPAATEVTAEQLASGEIAYKLNGDQSEIAFYQTIGTDEYPTLSSESKQVYVEASFYCDGVTPKGETTYSNNSEATVTIDSHDFVDGFCTNCGNIDETYMVANAEGYFEIGTPEQLVWFASYVNNVNMAANAVLTADITLVDDWTTPAGNWVNSAAYKGHFDGQGHVIKGFTGTSTQNYFGIFGVISTGALIENFTIYGDINSTYQCVGAVAGYARDATPTIRNIHSFVNINNTYAGGRQGGILGSSNNGTVVVDRCWYSGTLDGNDAGGSGNYGGIVGYLYNNTAAILTVSNCLFDGKVVNNNATPGNCTFGGVIGYNNGGKATIKNCLSIGTVTSTVTGQFFGKLNGNNSTFANNYYMGEFVNGTGSAGAASGDEPVLVDEGQLESDEIVLKLGIAFRQNLGKDDYPVLDATHNVVTEITDAGYATLFVDNADLTVPAGVTAYVAEVEKTWLKLSDIGGTIPASTPVILKGTPAVYEFVPGTEPTVPDGALGVSETEVDASQALVKEEGLDASFENVLKGAADDIDAAGKYVLAQPGSEPIGFYQAETGTIKAGKAYLELTSDVKAFYFLFPDEDPTGIANVENVQNENGAIYNLAGQRIQKMQKGVNIVNGKKILK